MEGTLISFLIDTGAEYSVLKAPMGKTKKEKTLVIGATGQKFYPWTTSRTVDLGKNNSDPFILGHPRVPYAPSRERLINQTKGPNNFCPYRTRANVESTPPNFGAVPAVRGRISDVPEENDTS